MKQMRTNVNNIKKQLFFLPLLLLTIFACKGAASNIPKTPIKIIFDSTKITCKKGFSKEINSGTIVKENDRLHFEAKLNSGETVENWYLNGNKEEYSTSEAFSITVKSNIIIEEGGEKVIKVDYKPKTAIKAKVIFDSTKITCTKGFSEEINSGTIVKENDRLHFEAKLNSGETVENWYLNGNKEEYSTSKNYNLTVKESSTIDENGEKVIKVSYTVK